jgi:hypothetical protein
VRDATSTPSFRAPFLVRFATGNSVASTSYGSDSDTRRSGEHSLLYSPRWSRSVPRFDTRLSTIYSSSSTPQHRSFCLGILVSKMYALRSPRLALCAILAVLTAAMVAQAQSSSTTLSTASKASFSSSLITSAPTSSGDPIPPAVTHTVQVGLADHKFNPDTVRTAQGDVSSSPLFAHVHPYHDLAVHHVAAVNLSSNCVPDCRVRVLPSKPLRRES